MKIRAVTPYFNINAYKNANNLKTKTNNNNTKKGFELSNVYYPIISFTSEDKNRTYSTKLKKLAEIPSNFKVCKHSGIPCPACGQKMLSRSSFEKITKELQKIPQDKYLDYLGNYTEYMRPVELSVYNELLELSQKPEASKDIRTLLVQLRDTKLPVLQEVQMKQINKMKALAKTLPEDEKKVLTSKVNSLKNEIRRTNPQAPFRRKFMLDRISKIQIRNPKKYEKLQRIASNFPTSTDMNSAWIVKYSGKNKMHLDWDSYSIALRFLYSSVANTDHIVAYSLERNNDDITNYMSMHNACNSQKANKTFLHWLHEDKNNRIEYMKNYFNAVNELITSKKIKTKKYKKYVAYATETIYEASKGQVDIRPKPENIEPKTTT